MGVETRNDMLDPLPSLPPERGEGLYCLLGAPSILCRTRSRKTIAGETREILSLSVSCHASTAFNDPQFLQRTQI
jgi:hypothetical protein